MQMQRGRAKMSMQTKSNQNLKRTMKMKNLRRKMKSYMRMLRKQRKMCCHNSLTTHLRGCLTRISFVSFRLF
jgi:cell shape-determining protein MreC